MNIVEWLRGARALWRSARAGQVNANMASNRATHCANCPWLVRDGGVLTRAVSWGYEKLNPIEGHGEPWLSRQPWKCQLCQCSLRVKLRLPLPFILRHTPTNLYDRLPREICWIRIERPQLDCAPGQEQE